jgi:SAM-dependent MidA family methyltransferase
MTVARYMEFCLAHPRHGYYASRDPFGAAGDFTTAPEISQMFGEMLGLWAVALWQSMHAPAPFRLIELGPGRGTLMADALRAARVAPGFIEAVDVQLVETSARLRDAQRRSLSNSAVPAVWHALLEHVPEGPFILLANEFLDALPVHQAVKTESGWHERVVGVDEHGKLAFGLSRSHLPDFEALPAAELADAPLGAVFEWRPDTFVAEICSRLQTHPGAALFIDYGHSQSGLGDTLQAVRAHAFADPLSSPGEVDLTAHVDFAAVARIAKQCGIDVHGPVEQGSFLEGLGIVARAEKLRANTLSQQAAAIDAALVRLTGSGRENMGSLFKVIALTSPKLAPPPGFAT